jgi:hypothetical protein
MGKLSCRVNLRLVGVQTLVSLFTIFSDNKLAIGTISSVTEALAAVCDHDGVTGQKLRFPSSRTILKAHILRKRYIWATSEIENVRPLLS